LKFLLNGEPIEVTPHAEANLSVLLIGQAAI
jgi:hypothetical protein